MELGKRYPRFEYWNSSQRHLRHRVARLTVGSKITMLSFEAVRGENAFRRRNSNG
jgi:hypothetical protein